MRATTRGPVIPVPVVGAHGQPQPAEPIARLQPARMRVPAERIAHRRPAHTPEPVAHIIHRRGVPIRAEQAGHPRRRMSAAEVAVAAMSARRPVAEVEADTPAQVAAVTTKPAPEQRNSAYQLWVPQVPVWDLGKHERSVRRS